MSQTDPSQSRHLQLAELLDLGAVRALHDQLLSFRGQDLVIDAGAVERIGGQGVQLLLSARESWARDGVSFAIENPSQTCLSALAILGVSPNSLNVKGASQ